MTTTPTSEATPRLTASRHVSPAGVPGAWVVQYPFLEPGKSGNAIDIAPTRASLLELVDAVAFSEGWTRYEITFHVNIAQGPTTPPTTPRGDGATA